MNYLNTFLKTLEILKSNSSVEIQHLEIGESYDVESIENLIQSMGFPPFPKEIVTFLAEISLLELDWLDKTGEIEGSLRVKPLEYILGNCKDYALKLFPHIDKESHEDLEHFFFVENSNENLLVGFIAKKGMEDALYFLQNDIDGFLKSSVNYTTYLTRMVQTAGIINWDLNLLYPDTPQHQKMESDLKTLNLI